MVLQSYGVGRRGVTIVSRLNDILAYSMIMIMRVTPLNTIVTPLHRWLAHVSMGISATLINTSSISPRLET
jgi:hypothetical protein